MGAASFEVAVDPRFELLSVVKHLAGHGPVDAQTEAYRKKIDLRFGAFQNHPAVALYRDFAVNYAREESCATILIYFTAPPELKLKDKNAVIHYLDDRGAREDMHRFLWELRDFARTSGFMAFFKENAEFYSKIENDAKRELGALDPVASIESLIGMGLSSFSHYILAPLLNNTHAFIVPYPLPPAHLGAKSFDVYTTSRHILNDIWPEPLYVFIDPSFYYFEKLNIPDPLAFYGPEVSRCRALSPDCAKQYVAYALIEHLNRRAGIAGQKSSAPSLPSKLDRRYLKSMLERLEEYERERARYPSLWTFYPRLFSVFHELAHNGKPAKLAVPAEPAIRNIADFFDPTIVKQLAP